MEDGLRVMKKQPQRLASKLVLILVVMEDGLRAISISRLGRYPTVLILVVMEDGLRDGRTQLQGRGKVLVLILVVMEDGLRGRTDLGSFSHVSGVLILVVMEDGLRGAGILS